MEMVSRVIVEYVHRGQPETTCRDVFVRHTVPVGGAVGLALMQRVIRRAFAGVEGYLH